MARMFEGLKTWNPWFGCKHQCYRNGCWPNRRLAHRLGKMLKCADCHDFKPHLHEERLDKIPADPRIFVVAHGDLFGNWVPNKVILKILEKCRATPKEAWFFETKNPRRYFEFLGLFPEHTILSTTIETNRVYPAEIRGYTLTPEKRFEAMLTIRKYSSFPIHVSIEPIMDFDFNILVSWMQQLKPIKVAVGYDSLNNNLPEPAKIKTYALINRLELFTDVERKQL